MVQYLLITQTHHRLHAHDLHADSDTANFGLTLHIGGSQLPSNHRAQCIPKNAAPAWLVQYLQIAEIDLWAFLSCASPSSAISVKTGGADLCQQVAKAGAQQACSKQHWGVALVELVEEGGCSHPQNGGLRIAAIGHEYAACTWWTRLVSPQYRMPEFHCSFHSFLILPML